ncbi:MAG: hypothetical protein HY707_12855 [Ignavibacteriae bacterium]|nr:hypothetical protein [Ignavibacteriota bacterium]
MKYLGGLLLVFMLMCSVASAQFKSQTEQPSVSRSLIHPRTSISSFLGLLNPDNFMMRHSVSFSYATSGGKGISLASYTNSMLYRISDPLNVRFDVTLQGSPFGNYGSGVQSELSRLYLSRAELNYQPSQNFFIQLQYHQLPFYYLGSYNPFLTPSVRGDE